MPAKIKQVALITCLFLFLFVVIGGGLHLNPGGAFLAAATGTPLVIHFFNRQMVSKVSRTRSIVVIKESGVRAEYCRNRSKAL